MTEPRRLPDFLVVGAMKAATTSVWQALAAHPDVFMSPVKDPKYFAFVGDQRVYRGPSDPLNNRHWADRSRYLALFESARPGSLIGETSTIYLYKPETAGNIAREIPGARIIAVLREPADRAYSHFSFARQRGFEPEASFARALELEDDRVRRGWGHTWHYRRMGLYADQLDRYLESFPRENVFVGLYDDLRADPGAFYRSVFRFLGLAEDPPIVVMPELNRSAGVRSVTVARFSRLLRQVLPEPLRNSLANSPTGKLLAALTRPIDLANKARRPTPPSETLDSLRRHYSASTRRLEQMMGCDLSRWTGDSVG